MSAFSPVRRAEVVARAGDRCEYCHLPTWGQVATFPIDHIIPRVRDVTNDLSNFALTCPNCNAQKGTAETAADPETGQYERLFHPRHDVWKEHFRWGDHSELVGLTAVGRSTISALDMNSDLMLELRRLLSQCGLFLELAER